MTFDDLINDLVNCLYFYEAERIRKLDKFCERYVHRQYLYNPILEIEKDHLSSNAKQKLIELRK